MTSTTTSTNVPYILSPQEELDCEDMVEPIYDYNDPNHKPPFKYVDYTEINADSNQEMNRLAFGLKGKYLCQITESNKIAYLYHNKNTNRIGIWGESRKFDKVINQLNNRYEIAKQIIATNASNASNAS